MWNFAKLNMRAVYAVRSLFTNIHFLQFNPHLSQKASSGTFNGVINLHSSSWPLLRITKTARKVDSLYLINHSTACYTTKPTRPFRDNIQLNKRITSLKTVEDQLELFNSFKNSANIVNRVTMLHCIAKIAERDKKQKQMLKMGQQRENSPYLELLESITAVISKIQSRHLANLMWALGKIGEKEHKLVKVCEKEILSHGIVAFNNAEICQIVNGCANLNLKTSRIFGSLQEAVLNGQLTIEDFEDRQLWGILLSFCKTNNGSAGMFDVVLKEILSRDISKCQPQHLANLMWALGQIGEKEHKLVDICEKEILSHGIVAFGNAGICQIVNGCVNLNLKTSRIFGSLQEAVLNGQLTIEDFEDRQLWGILLSFCKISAAGSAGMFDVVLKEILSRDISKCQPRDLANLMWALGQIGEKEHKLVDICEKEILSRDIMAFNNAHICQIMNGCANLNLKTSRIFGSLQEAILNGQLKIEDFEDRELWGILLSFCKMSTGSAGMFDVVLNEILSRGISKCQRRELANLMWALGQIKEKEHKLVDICEKEILSRGIMAFDNVGICQIVNGCANLNLRTSSIFGSLQEAILNGQLKIEDFEDLQLRAVLLSFCKIENVSGICHFVLKELLSRGISKFQPREIANLMWALGQIGEKEHKLVKACEKEILSHGIVAFNNAGICQIVNGCANLNLKTSRIFGSLQEAVLNGQLMIEDFEDRQLWGILLSFCKTNNGSAGMFDVVLKEILSRDISKCQPQHLANLMWALGQIGEKEHKLVDICEKEILSHGIVAFGNAEICQIVNGCANLNLKTSRIFGSLQEAVLNGQLTIEDFENRQLWGILLSFCKMSAGSAGMFDVVLKEILSRDISKCQRRDLANLMWALGQIGEKEHKLVDICEKEILSRDIMAFNNAHICQIMNGCANLNLKTSRIFGSLQEAILNGQLKIEDFEDRELWGILLSFCKMSTGSAGMFDVVLKEISSRGISKCQPRDLANLMWALGQIKEKEHKLVDVCEKEILSRGIMAFDNAGICQIVNGCANLNLRTSRIFGELHEAILNGQVKIEGVGPSEFTAKQKRILMRGFIQSKNGSKDFFKLLLSSFSGNDFSNLTQASICDFSWCLSNAGVEAGALFDALEYEILSKDKSYFNKKELAYIKFNFKEAGKGSKALFELKV